ncbi:hypothetical protein [Pseudobacteriovorax antillogorgiicola]|nr:hypothetical protein [Pseudobacteriovorax antillogorgiicola]
MAANRSISSIPRSDIERYNFRKNFEESFLEQEFRFPKTLNLKYFREDNVQFATLILDDRIYSKPTDRRQFFSDTIQFRFNKPILPGVYRASLLVQPNNSTIDIETKIDSEGTVWAVTTSGRYKVGYMDFLASLSKKSIERFLSAVLGIVFLAISIAFVRTKYFFILLTISLVISVLATTDSMSGHDETAHLDMMYRSFHVEGKAPVQLGSFYNQSYDFMEQNDFYYLHKLHPVRNTCIHRIVGHCGISSQPMNWYQDISLFSNPLTSPHQFVFYHQVITLLLLIICITSAYFFLENGYFQGFLVGLILCGGFWSAIPSITNDIPLFIGGFMSLIAFSTGSERWKKFCRPILSFVLVTIFILILKYYDRSWITIFLIIPFLTINEMANNNQSRSVGFGRAALELVSIVILSIFLAFLLVKFSDRFVFFDRNIWDLISSNIDHKILSILDGPQILSLSFFGAILNGHIKSVFGTFVWGHSQFSEWMYIFCGIVVTFLSTQGWKSYRESTTVLKASFIGVAMVVSYTACILIITSISLPYVDHSKILLESYTKIRLVGPLIFLYFMFVVRGFGSLKTDTHEVFGLRLGIFCYVALVNMYFLPKFFYYDKFW